MREGVDSDRAYVNAVLNWFRTEPFVYTLAPPLLDRDPVDGFLFDTRRGFCEHYAGAFTVLLRAAGIPARVVTGYQGGEMNLDGDYMIVRQSDAHAWAEALLDGQWQRFDPTAAVAPSRIEARPGRCTAGGRAGTVFRPAGNDVAQEPQAEMGRRQLPVAARRRRLQHRAPARLVGRVRIGRRATMAARGGRCRRRVRLGPTRAWRGATTPLASRRRSRLVECPSAAGSAAPAFPAHRKRDRSPTRRRAGKRWPQWASVLERIGERYAQLHYGPRDPKCEQFLEELKAGVASLPGPRALNEASRSTSTAKASPETVE